MPRRERARVTYSRRARRSAKRFHPPAAHADIPVVQVDGRVAVARDQPYPVAQPQALGLGAEAQLAVLVRDRDHLDVLAAVHPRRSFLGAVGFEAGIDDRAIRGRRAHHGREHEQAVLELGVAAAIDAADAGVVGVHERVGAALQLIVDAARRFEPERTGAGTGDRLAAEVIGSERV
jgi:hypothetical protein